MGGHVYLVLLQYAKNCKSRECHKLCMKGWITPQCLHARKSMLCTSTPDGNHVYKFLLQYAKNCKGLHYKP